MTEVKELSPMQMMVGHSEDKFVYINVPAGESLRVVIKITADEAREIALSLLSHAEKASAAN